ncbi:MAG: hypothetical protein BM557_04980 [Flavobacterium sp. MedPE-SWcel]|uniref:retropepsin-like aspartic protease n=1 Tax=uncultured Flavobacterium sp. TaxID=165435 RepID=UPI0009227F78|nr:retropepsin-like aspartic protease [uncultured Flavobacterium sp.]OIQ21109.1 MAG: hypothetical protein BM557_04980 [Flavobacterium sp. MedPE-SWcel]
MRYFKALLLVVLLSSCASREQLPVLNATTQLLSIQDGNKLHENVWTATPNVDIDEFIVQKFEGEKMVHFISDIDTLSFSVTPNNNYDFIVLINGKEKALTRISTDTLKEASIPHQKMIDYYYDDRDKRALIDTIPFTLGNDNRIHFKGRVNNSKPLDILFDTGANAVVVVSSLIGKEVQLKLDGEVDNNGSDGSQIVPTSSDNQLEVLDLNWDGLNILSIDYQAPSFDVVLGWIAFENKIVEIDYEKKYLVIHQSKETVSNDYSKIETKMIHGIPYIKGTLDVAGKQSSGWFEYDSGSNGSFSLSQKFASENGLNNVMKVTGRSISTGSVGVEYSAKNYVLPKLTFGEYELVNVPIAIDDEDPEGVEYNDILGNNLLKRFNTVIDFKEFEIYLKPNSLFYSEY